MSLLSAAAIATAAQAQGGPNAAASSTDASEHAAIVEWISEQLRDVYVFPEVADSMIASLHRQLENGAWDGFTDIQEFLRALSDQLLEISGDRHIGIRYAPEPSARAQREDPAEEERRRESLLRTWQYGNFKFKKVEYLDGNIGYLRFDRFYAPAAAANTAVAALQFLAHTDALIIDLRHNGGGNAGMIRLLLSYFFDEATHINSWYDRKDDRTIQSWTSDHVEGRRLADTDLYILTSGATFSAAEEFTYDLQSLGRATVVGARTGGGGHTVELRRNDALKIEFSVPNSRAINPVTGTNWEGTGVAPDVEVPSEEALEAAYVLALQRLHEAAEPGSNHRAYLGWIADYHGTRRAPGPLPPVEVMRSYAGTYGPAEVRFHDDRLFLVGPGGGAEQALLPLSDGRFVIDGMADIRVEFERDAGGNVVALYGVFFDGSRDRFPRGP